MSDPKPWTPTDWHNDCCYCAMCKDARAALDRAETHLQNMHASQTFGALMAGDDLAAIDHAASITPATLERMQAAVDTVADYMAAKAVLDTVNDDEKVAA